MIDIKTRRKMVAILRVLEGASGPVGAERIAEALRVAGFELSERTVRNYLARADEVGWTINLGRRGRQLTDAGRKELEGALVVDKVGFIAARVDALAYQMDFNLSTGQGRIILNVSTIAAEHIRDTLPILAESFEAGLGMGRYLAIGKPGELLGDFRVPLGHYAIGTVCSVSINGIFLHANIATTSRFGSLLQMKDGRPVRFSEIIFYDGSSLDPLEIFIRGFMTSVSDVARTGSGLIGASFREVPAIALQEARRLAKRCEEIGIGGLLMVGSPNQTVLDIPVPYERAGIVVCGGLNPVAAVVEHAIPARNVAMRTLCDFNRLVEYTAIMADPQRFLG